MIFIKLLKHQKRKNLKMQKQYPEVHSLEESLAILKKYKDDVNKEDYEGIKSVISNHAIESIYAKNRRAYRIYTFASRNP